MLVIFKKKEREIEQRSHHAHTVNELIDII